MTSNWNAGPGTALIFARESFQLGSHATLTGTVVVTGPSAVVGVGELEASAANISLTNYGCCSHGTLEVAGPSTSHIANLTVNGEAKLKGAGDVEVAITLNLGKSTIEGESRLVIGLAATATVEEEDIVTVSGRQLVNYGELILSRHGYLDARSSASLINHNVMIDNGQVTAEGPGSYSLKNDATLRRTEGPTETSGISWALDNEGAISVETGRLELTGGGTSDVEAEASWSTSLGAEIEFAGGHFSLGAKVPMEGTFQAHSNTTVQVGKIIGVPDLSATTGSICGCIDNPVIDVAEPLLVGRLFLNFGTLIAARGTTITGSFQWNGGKLLGGSTTELQSGIPANIELGGDAGVLEGTLVNATTVKWTEGSINGLAGTEIVNDGIFEVSSEAPFARAALSAEPLAGPVFHNNGEFDARGTVGVSWEFIGHAPEPGGDPVGLICLITQPEAKPPKGIFSIAQSGTVTFFPLPGSAAPPSYEPFTKDWECEEP